MMLGDKGIAGWRIDPVHHMAPAGTEKSGASYIGSGH
jgi:hypothetical protein